MQVNGQPVGSALIGVDLTAAGPRHDPWFHVRPSGTASDLLLGVTDPSTSGGSNLAADNPKLIDLVTKRKVAIADREGVPDTAVPADAVTASTSGLDPDISPAYAQPQIPRVARENKLTEDTVRRIVTEQTHGRSLGVLGEPTINALALNIAIHNAAAR